MPARIRNPPSERTAVSYIHSAMTYFLNCGSFSSFSFEYNWAFLPELDLQQVEGFVAVANHRLIKTQSRSRAWLP
jgi:hypothetical protein